MDWQTEVAKAFCRKNKVTFWFEDHPKTQARRFWMKSEDGIATDRLVDFARLDESFLVSPFLNDMLSEINAFRKEKAEMEREQREQAALESYMAKLRGMPPAVKESTV